MESTRPRPAAAACGIAAVAGGLGAAQASVAVSDSLRSPLLDIGDRFIDVVPSWLKTLAIAWFGTGDKVALLAGMGLVIALAAAGVGMLAFRGRMGVALTVVIGFGILGAAAAVIGRGQATATLPSATATVVSVGLLLGFRAPPPVDDFTGARRRTFLRLAAFSAAGLVAVGAGATLLERRGSGAARLIDLGRIDMPLPPPRAATSLDTANISPLYTPNSSFYRIDTALAVPRIDATAHRLEVTGMVERPLVLTVEQLLDRRLIEADVTLACVSNEVGGNLVGNARWIGVRLDELLEEVGVDPGADQIVGRSVDGYTAGFPVAVLDGRPALIALGMNGVPLPPEHGYPLRLVVPGLYGYVSATKWLSEIELTTFSAFDHYWERRGWAEQAPIKTQSRIDTPRGLATVPTGAGMIAGVAWAPTRGITRVEVQVDGGEWQEAELADAIDDNTWRQWRHRWEVTPGRHSIRCRAADGTGAMQPEDRSEPVPDGATGWHQIVVIGEE